MPRPRNPKLDDVGWLAEVYESHSTREIAAILNCGISTIPLALRRAGIPVRPSGTSPHPYEHLRNREWLVNAYSIRGLTTHQIAAELGAPQITVWKAMHALKVPFRRVKGKSKNRYVWDYEAHMPAHRAVMAKHMGRSLLATEHVHHKDGDPRNNELSNLVVLSKSEHHSHHGRLYPHVCIKCGISFQSGVRAKWCQACCPRPDQRKY